MESVTNTVARKPRLITRSISFDPALLEYAKVRATRERRSVNWIVNDIIREEKERRKPRCTK